MGGVIVIVFLVMIVNLLVDLSYALLDPRIRLGGGAE
jgi:ABC-type dipeptide/oligopeptide/nickel transport system permease component